MPNNFSLKMFSDPTDSMWVIWTTCIRSLGRLRGISRFGEMEIRRWMYCAFRSYISGLWLVFKWPNSDICIGREWLGKFHLEKNVGSDCWLAGLSEKINKYLIVILVFIFQFSIFKIRTWIFEDSPKCKLKIEVKMYLAPNWSFNFEPLVLSLHFGKSLVYSLYQRKTCKDWL